MKRTRLRGANFGDILSRPKFLFVDHVGIYLDNGRVLHNSPNKGEHVSNVHEFASGQEIQVIPTPLNMKAKMMERVQNTLRYPRSYDAPTNNCEHTVTRIIEGRGYSPTVLAGLLTLAVAVIAISRK